MNIESYDGDDAYYTGSDEEYAEFLKNVEGEAAGEEAVPVENTQRVSLGDTINLQGVIDKFKEKAGEFSSAAKKFKEDLSSQFEDLKAAASKSSAEKAEPQKETEAEPIVETAEPAPAEEAHEEPIITKVIETPPSRSIDIDGFREGMTAVAEGLSAVDKKLDAVDARIAELSDKLRTVELQGMESGKEASRGFDDLRQSTGSIEESIGDMKQETAGISKLTDSVFDLKNTQVNTKNTLSELEMSFVRLKKKCIVGIVILSLLGAVAIGLQIVQLLS